MKKYFLFLLPLFILGAGCQKTVPTERPLSQESNSQVFCGPDGELSRTFVKQENRKYCLQTQKTEPALNTPLDFSFVIIDDRGETVKDFDIFHEKLMHVIVLRQDMNGFQHVHPEFNSENGYFTLKDLTVPTDGSYILYFDFTPKNGEPIVLFEGIAVGDSSKNSKPNLTLSQSPQIVDKFSVQMRNLEEKKIFKSGEETKITFHIDGKENQPIEHVENYLGAKGHLVIIKEGSLDYIHAHPEEKKIVAKYNDIPFDVHFSAPGKYKMFLQFQYGGEVYTTEYVVEVAPGKTNTAPIEHMIHQ